MQPNNGLPSLITTSGIAIGVALVIPMFVGIEFTTFELPVVSCRLRRPDPLLWIFRELKKKHWWLLVGSTLNLLQNMSLEYFINVTISV